MHRFYISPSAVTETEAVISGPDAEQIRRVLRLGIGDTIAVFDGTGRQFCTQITSLSKEQVCLRIVSCEHPPTESLLRIVLAQSLLKGDKLDLVVQKGTELGVSSFIFLRSERTISEITQSKKLEKLARWHRIAKEAAEQSGRVCVPDIDGPEELPAVIERQAALGPVLIPWEKESQPLQPVLEKLKETNPSVVTLVVGPEGGFAEKEVIKARELGAVSVSLGPRILRAETASIVVTALVMSTLEQGR